MAENTGFDKTPVPAPDYDVSKVPEPIRRRSNWTRTKFTGDDVLESVAQIGEIAGLYAGEAKQLAEHTQVRQDEVEDFNNQVIQEMTDKDVMSAPEIIESRKGEATLSLRLDKDKNEMLTKLEQLAINVKYPPIPLIAAKGDGVTDDTEAINNIMNYCDTNNFSDVFLPHAVYLIDPSKPSQNLLSEGGIKLKSNVNITMEKGTVLKAIPCEDQYYDIISGVGVDNVTITNGLVLGERDAHLGVGGEWGHGIKLLGTKKITLNNVMVKDCWGDGLYLGRMDATRRFCEDTKILESTFDRNRRQGISVITVKGLYGLNVTVSNTHGASPSAGIDFEPNQPDEFLEGIQFDNLRALGNFGSGLMVYPERLETGDLLPNISMIFNNYVAEDNGHSGINMSRFNKKTTGSIVFNNPRIKNTGSRSVLFRAWGANGPRVILNNPVVINSNKERLQADTEYNPFTFIRNANDYATDPDFIMGNVEINNPQVIRDDGLPEDPYHVSFQDVVRGTNTPENAFENVKLNGIDKSGVYGWTLLKKSEITTAEEVVWELSTNGTNVPLRNNFVDYYKLSRWISQNMIVVLRSDMPEYAEEITFVYETPIGSSSFVQYIRPSATERIYPLKYSNGNGKGLMMPNAPDPTGSSVTFKRINGKWHITNIVGSWEAEV